MIDAHDIKDGVSVTDVRRVILRLKPRRNGKRKGEGGRLCGVRLRVMRQSTSGEHKFKLMSLLLSRRERRVRPANLQHARGRAGGRGRWQGQGQEAGGAAAASARAELAVRGRSSTHTLVESCAPVAGVPCLFQRPSGCRAEPHQLSIIVLAPRLVVRY